jgi:hypothetical protein
VLFDFCKRRITSRKILVFQGLTFPEIARELNANSYRSWRDSKWTAGHVRQVLARDEAVRPDQPTR